MTVLLGTLWSSIKQIEAPYVFDWENPIALHAMQGNRDGSTLNRAALGEPVWRPRSSLVLKSHNLGSLLSG